MTLASPSYSADTIPFPECEPYKKVIRTLTDTVHEKDEAISRLQLEVDHKESQIELVTKYADSQGGTDIGTIALSVGFGLLAGFAAGKLIK